ncbi:hypothetical protein [Mangrovicoccus ximenensis]|nr:hypothetical protein [Mangrovicoccus ximenensis]
MKAMFSGFAAIALIGVAAYFGLHALGLSSEHVFSSPNVRVD